MEWQQAAEEYRKMNSQQRKAFLDNVAASLMFAPEETQETILSFFYRINEELGHMLEKRLDF